MALAGPKDVSAAFTEGGKLLIVDGRGNMWTYDTGITEDADGNEIVAPTSFDAVAIAPGRERLIVISGGTVWNYNLNQGEWHEGLPVTDMLEGEAEKTTDPWKRGHNVETPAVEETSPAGGRKRKREAA